MKRTLAIVLAVLMLAAALASCAGTANSAATSDTSPRITLTSSDASDAAAWLAERLGDKLTDRVVIGTDADGYGVDVSALEDDGYIIRTVGGEVALFARTTDGLDRAARKYAKAVEAGEQIGDVTYHEGARIEKLTIAGNDISTYAIKVEGEWEYLRNWVLNNNAPVFAALVEEACGFKPEIGAEAEHYIVFRQSDAFAPEDECNYAYRVEDGDLVFEYGYELGAKNAMLMFLENELGWKYLIHGDDDLPEADLIAVPADLSVDGKVAFASGLLTQGSPNPSFDNAVLNKGCWALYPSGFWARVRHANHGLQIHQWGDVNVGVTWFQICYSNKSMQSSVVDAIYTYIIDKQEAGSVIGDDLNWIDVAQGDNASYCQCKDCKLTYAEEGGAISGAVVRWANELDKELDELGFEGLKYLIYAYHGTNKPCVTAPNDDVVVCFCLDGNCYRHALDGSQCKWESFYRMEITNEHVGINNSEYAEWIRGWCELSPHIQVWYYAMGANVHQFSMVFPLWEDLKFMKDCGVAYVYWMTSEYSGLGTTPFETVLVTEYQMRPDMTRTEYREALRNVLENRFGDGWREALELVDLWEEAEMRVQNCACGWTYNVVVDNGMLDYAFWFENKDRIISLVDEGMKKVNSAAEELKFKNLAATYLYTICYAGHVSGASLDDLADIYTRALSYMTETGFDYTEIPYTGGGRLYDTIFETAEKVW